MASNIKKAEGVSLIDCSMIVIEPEDGTSDGIAFTSASKLGVEAKTQTRDAIPNTIKGEVKAQKPEEVTLTGHTLTLTDTTMIMAFLPILQGGTLTMDEDGATPIKYEPPSSGKNEGKKFKLKAYTAIMEGASTVGYGCVTYPGCQGTPVLWNFEDDGYELFKADKGALKGKCFAGSLEQQYYVYLTHQTTPLKKEHHVT